MKTQIHKNQTLNPTTDLLIFTFWMKPPMLISPLVIHNSVCLCGGRFRLSAQITWDRRLRELDVGRNRRSQCRLWCRFVHRQSFTGTLLHNVQLRLGLLFCFGVVGKGFAPSENLQMLISNVWMFVPEDHFSVPRYISPRFSLQLCVPAVA